jgi:hypothetical protein
LLDLVRRGAVLRADGHQAVVSLDTVGDAPCI